MQLVGGKGFRRAMAWAPAGLAAGFALGAWAHGGGPDFLTSLADILGPLGTLWTRALSLSVFPLVVSLLVSGIGGMETKGGFGRWGFASIAVFLGILLLGALLVIGVGFLYLPQFGPTWQEGLAGGPAPPEATSLSFGDWIENLLPANLIQAAANGEMLPVTLSAILFALAIRQIPSAAKDRVVVFFRAIRDAVLVYVGWVLILMPFGTFALAYAFAAKVGLDAAGAALHFLGFTVVLLLAMTLLLYPLASLLGRIPLLRFAKSVFPAQTVAVGSRSSLACLPSLVQGANDLDLPAPAADLVLPLATSVFKPNRTVSSTAKLLFLASLFGIALSPADVLSFVLTVIVLSISTPGLPSMGTRMTFGAYVAAGLPPAGVMLFEALDPIVDVFKTLLNATANLAAAAIASRFAGGKPELEPNPAPVLAPEPG